MRFHCMGKYNLDPESLPSSELVPGAVRFKEAKDAKTLGLIANGVSIGIAVVTFGLLFWRGGFNAWSPVTQMPKGSYTYLHKFNSYWYMPEKS